MARILVGFSDRGTHFLAGPATQEEFPYASYEEYATFYPDVNDQIANNQFVRFALGGLDFITFTSFDMLTQEEIDALPSHNHRWRTGWRENDSPRGWYIPQSIGLPNARAALARTLQGTAERRGWRYAPFQYQGNHFSLSPEARSHALTSVQIRGGEVVHIHAIDPQTGHNIAHRSNPRENLAIMAEAHKVANRRLVAEESISDGLDSATEAYLESFWDYTANNPNFMEVEKLLNAAFDEPLTFEEAIEDLLLEINRSADIQRNGDGDFIPTIFWNVPQGEVVYIADDLTMPSTIPFSERPQRVVQSGTAIIVDARSDRPGNITDAIQDLRELDRNTPSEAPHLERFTERIKGVINRANYFTANQLYAIRQSIRDRQRFIDATGKAWEDRLTILRVEEPQNEGETDEAHTTRRTALAKEAVAYIEQVMGVFQQYTPELNVGVLPDRPTA